MQEAQRSLVKDGYGHVVGTVPKWFPWLTQVIRLCLLTSICLLVGSPFWEVLNNKEVDNWWYPYSMFLLIFFFAVFVWQGEVIEVLTQTYTDVLWPGRRLAGADIPDTEYGLIEEGG